MQDFMRQFFEGITSDYFRREVLPYWVMLAVSFWFLLWTARREG